ncbi:MAG: glycosyltransferase [Candidatus Acidiferrum sp.]
MAKPFVSVLIDTYNHERFIAKAIESVLEQDFPSADREIIVVDDGSTDRTPEIIRNFEPHVRVLRKENGGQASAFNVGIPECKGEIIAFLDGDDWWAPGKLKRVTEVLNAEPSVGLLGHGIHEAFADGRIRTSVPEKNERLTLNSLAAARVFRLRRSFLGTSRMILRTELARRILPIPDALVFEADEYVFTLGALLSELVILQDALTYYGIHGGNLYLSNGGGKAGLRRKQQVMDALASALRKELSGRGAPPEVVSCIVEIVQTEADQLRLMLGGGTPWETVRTENKIYEMMHADAPRSHRIFRAVSMVPAMFLPPRWYYAGRGWLGSRSWYRWVRKHVLPVPEMTRIAGPEEFKA